jgi:hypothetical protein
LTTLHGLKVSGGCGSVGLSMGYPFTTTGVGGETAVST